MGVRAGPSCGLPSSGTIRRAALQRPTPVVVHAALLGQRVSHQLDAWGREEGRREERKNVWMSSGSCECNAQLRQHVGCNHAPPGPQPLRPQPSAPSRRRTSPPPGLSSCARLLGEAGALPRRAPGCAPSPCSVLKVRRSRRGRPEASTGSCCAGIPAAAAASPRGARPGEGVRCRSAEGACQSGMSRSWMLGERVWGPEPPPPLPPLP